MRFIRKTAVVLIRPIYKAFLERPLWWFLAKVKAFFFAETLECLAVLENRVKGIEDRLNNLEANHAAEWDGIEQLLLAMFRQPACATLEPASDDKRLWAGRASEAAGFARSNGPNNIR
jgi:hypothetical protein